MTDDTWWAFIAGIDREALLRELPGSADDRRMREQHAARVARLRAAQAELPPVSDVLAAERRAELVKASKHWWREHARIERDIAAYAATRRQA